MIHVKNVAEIILKILEDKDSIGQTIELGGNEDFTWDEIIKTIAKASNKKSNYGACSSGGCFNRCSISRLVEKISSNERST